MQTNAYATICNNFFDHVRRRSPRSSGLCVVHAFNNVLVQWKLTPPVPRQMTETLKQEIKRAAGVPS